MANESREVNEPRMANWKQGMVKINFCEMLDKRHQEEKKRVSRRLEMMEFDGYSSVTERVTEQSILNTPFAIILPIGGKHATTISDGHKGRIIFRGQNPNWFDLVDLISPGDHHVVTAQDESVASHDLTEIMASPETAVMLTALEHGGDGDALVVQLNDDMLRALRSMAPDKGRIGSRPYAVDEGGGPYVSIDMDGFAQQKSDLSSAAAARKKKTDGASDNPYQCTLQSLFGGIVPFGFVALSDVCKGGECPKLIKVVLYSGLVFVTGLAFIGITSAKMAKPATRVVVGASIAALTIAAFQSTSSGLLGA